MHTYYIHRVTAYLENLKSQRFKDGKGSVSGIKEKLQKSWKVATCKSVSRGI